MAGNYGGNSIPTTPISAILLINNPEDYENFICTAAINGNNFGYNGTIITMPPNGTMLKMMIDPGGIESANGDVKFLCYDCSCHSPYSGITTDSFVNYSGTTARFRPVIIGGGGLNS